MKILITGATGYIGKYVTTLLKDDCEKIYILTRKSESPFLSEKIEVIQGDLSESQIFSDVKLGEKVLAEIDVVLHMAALYKIDADEMSTYTNNILATIHLLDWIKKAPNLKVFHYISTIAVKGQLDGDLLEAPDRFPHVKHSNSYALTKAGAEMLVRNSDLGSILKRVYRPGIVIGDQGSGHVEKIDGPYFFLELFEKLRPLHFLVKRLLWIPLVYNPKAYLPLVPVDLLAIWLRTMVVSPKHLESPLRIYNLVPHKRLTMELFLKSFKETYQLQARFISLPESLGRFVYFLMGIPRELTEYSLQTTYYDTSNRLNDYPELDDYDFSDHVATFYQGYRAGREVLK